MKLTKYLLLLLLLASATTFSFAGDKENEKEDKDLPQAYKDGSINNINAIGNRNVGCDRGVGNWYSVDKQIAMGRAYADQVEHTSKIVDDPVVAEYVNRLGQNLVRHSDSKVPFTIKVVDSPEVNAFALPGGFFYVNSGLILAADNESELAGVMSHEIAHVAACHIAREQTRAQIASLASVPLIFMGGWAGYGIYQAANLGLPITFMKFSRNFEAQADYLGVQYMYASGYDPQSFVQFFEKLEAMEKKRTGTIAKAFESHPPTPDRAEKAQEEIEKILPPREQYILDTSEFEDVKSRLTVLESRHKLKNPREDRPELRHTAGGDEKPADTNSNPSSTPNSNSGDDDRPVLHRNPS